MPLHRIYSVKGVFSPEDKKVCGMQCPKLLQEHPPCFTCLSIGRDAVQMMIAWSSSQAIAERITTVYSLLPKFYVVVVFIDVDQDSFFIGGSHNDSFVRIVSQHLART